MWNTEELKQLKEITNHRVVYDGYEFVWEHKLNNIWERHYVRNFDDYNKPMSWIHFNISKWNKEYDKRSLDYLNEMKKNLEIEIKITEISREANIRTKNKINEILKLKPSMNNQQIADILGVTTRTIRRLRNE